MTRIAFYKSFTGRVGDKIIGTLSCSRYSHCEIVLEDGLCISSSYIDADGVRGKYINLGDHWDVFELVGDYDEDAMRYWAKVHDADTYDWLGAGASLFRIDLTSENKKFCSQVCALMIGIDPIITPGRLFNSLKRKNLITAD